MVVAIYATLGLARSLAGILGEGDQGALFGLGMVLVVAAMFTQRVGTRPGWAELGVWIGASAVYLLVFVRMAVPAERSHLIEYGVVALFVYEALTERRRQGHAVPAPALLASAVTTLVGTVDESLQLLIPSRVFDWRDILFNALAAMMAVTTSAATGWVAERFGTNRNW